MAQFFLLKINTTYLILEGELKQKNHHLINFLHVPMTPEISELQYSAVHDTKKKDL